MSPEGTSVKRDGRIIFIGTKPTGLAALVTIHQTTPRNLAGIITIDDSHDPRSATSDIIAFAREHRLPCRMLVKPAELREALAEMRADLAVVVGWYWVIPNDVMDIVPKGLVGVHGSLLPRYRGGAPLVWAIINGERMTGVTLFKFDQGIDSGDIIDQRRIPIGPEDTIGTLIDRMDVHIQSMLRTKIPQLLAGTSHHRHQDPRRATYCSVRKPDDGLFNWSWSAQRIHDWVRAQTHPYPGAFAKTPEGRTLRVWRTRIFERPYFGPPGLVARVEGSDAIVTCGSGAIRILSAHLEDGDGIASSVVFKTGMRLASPSSSQTT
jgi:methionyl-tRNA formyltransferase